VHVRNERVAPCVDTHRRGGGAARGRGQGAGGREASGLSLSLRETKSYLLKRLRAAPDTTGGREYGGQSAPRGASQRERKP
jgi:hypothetical protein